MAIRHVIFSVDNRTMSIGIMQIESLKLVLEPIIIKQLHFQRLLHDTLASYIGTAGQATLNITTTSLSTQTNLTGEALKWYTTSWVIMNILTTATAYTCAAILLLVLLGTVFWTLHRFLEELAADVQLDTRLHPFWEYVDLQCDLASRATAYRAGFLLLVYAPFLLMGEDDRHQAIEWQVCASVIVGCGLLAWWVLWFLDWWVFQGLWKWQAKGQSRGGEVEFFDEVWYISQLPGAWIV